MGWFKIEISASSAWEKVLRSTVRLRDQELSGSISGTAVELDDRRIDTKTINAAIRIR